MDELQLSSSWVRGGGGLPNAKVILKWSGLQMEGASFDGSRLVPNSAESPSIAAAPVCTVAWVPKVSCGDLGRN